MIDKEELLSNKEFYKSFKSGEDLTSFFKQLHKSAVEHMLNAELDAHLDNEKHEKTKDGNYRNGHGTKKIKSSFGESEIKVPRDRNGDFEPALFNSKDIVSLMRHLANNETTDKTDINKDGTFNSKDLIALMKKLSEK